MKAGDKIYFTCYDNIRERTISRIVNNEILLTDSILTIVLREEDYEKTYSNGIYTNKEEAKKFLIEREKRIIKNFLSSIQDNKRRIYYHRKKKSAN